MLITPLAPGNLFRRIAPTYGQPSVVLPVGDVPPELTAMPRPFETEAPGALPAPAQPSGNPTEQRSGPKRPDAPKPFDVEGIEKRVTGEVQGEAAGLKQRYGGVKGYFRGVLESAVGGLAAAAANADHPRQAFAQGAFQTADRFSMSPEEYDAKRSDKLKEALSLGQAQYGADVDRYNRETDVYRDDRAEAQRQDQEKLAMQLGPLQARQQGEEIDTASQKQGKAVSDAYAKDKAYLRPESQTAADARLAGIEKERGEITSEKRRLLTVMATAGDPQTQIIAKAQFDALNAREARLYEGVRVYDTEEAVGRRQAVAQFLADPKVAASLQAIHTLRRDGHGAEANRQLDALKVTLSNLGASVEELASLERMRAKEGPSGTPATAPAQTPAAITARAKSPSRVRKAKQVATRRGAFDTPPVAATPSQAIPQAPAPRSHPAAALRGTLSAAGMSGGKPVPVLGPAYRADAPVPAQPGLSPQEAAALEEIANPGEAGKELSKRSLGQVLGNVGEVLGRLPLTVEEEGQATKRRSGWERANRPKTLAEALREIFGQ